jgi:hypothetical protein
MALFPRDCYDRKPAREPWVVFNLPRSIFKKCVLDALEENEYAQTYFTDLTAKLRIAAKLYTPKPKGARK